MLEDWKKYVEEFFAWLQTHVAWSALLTDELAAVRQIANQYLDQLAAYLQSQGLDTPSGIGNAILDWLASNTVDIRALTAIHFFKLLLGLVAGGGFTFQDHLASKLLPLIPS